MRYAALGLITAASTPFQHLRRLARGGELLLTPGQSIEPSSRIGLNSSAELMHYLRVEIDEDKIVAKLLKQVGDEVKRGEPVAYHMYMFGLGYREYISPVNGTVVSINVRNGFVGIREHPEPVLAGLYGKVLEVIDGYGAVIAGHGAIVEGLAGWGECAWGPLHLASSGPENALDPAALGSECRGKIVVAGAYADTKLLHAAYRHGARAIVAGGVDQLAADEITALAAEMTVEEYQTRYYSAQAAAETELHAAHDRVLMPIIATDGLGLTPIRDGAWDILRQVAGQIVLVDALGHDAGAGQGRPLLFVAESAAAVAAGAAAEATGGTGHQAVGQGSDGGPELAVGALVRLLSGPHAGRGGSVVAALVDLELETGLKVPGARVALAGGGQAAVPAANLEVLVSRW